MAGSTHDLVDLLETTCCECFNADDANPLRNALAAECRDDASLLLHSDVDEGACAQSRPAALQPSSHQQSAQSCSSFLDFGSWLRLQRSP